MKSFDQVTRITQRKWLKQLAEAALGRYGIENAKLRFISTPSSTVFRVDTASQRYVLQVNPEPSDRWMTWTEACELIAFRCFGKDAQVPGGDYRAAALDMGGGLRSDLTGKGLGASIMEAAFECARHNFAPKAFRTTVAAFNKRALRVFEKIGYHPVQTFHSTHSGQTFIILMRDIA
ncbi:MAG: GNAT family protein [Caldilineaceae bacterium]